ncbi:Lrp/AsnC family transcriptional regulator [Aeromicrobium senzhongii]|uniref:Lrp/AsnC family transcriptional regulator n=1 Tax=Aeromicrobium senzhongii TaxID=2663859 RepID=A0ABX6SW74_9ACTN|nr:Lrp/AsnC family transcriptional regulator [Aeromicrobium senzhongii]MTB88166.1 AsnC family transcriptional regulator [Aeromicrobium senzhongii]QNL94842.1 Lrp/AsnC family transcriptional regulator [Aeromicrobium senzhongii]
MSLDQIDRDLLEALTEDGRASFAALGSRVGLSAPAVKRRVDRLVETGVISGFTVVVDPHHRGWTTEAYVEVHCQGTISPAVLREAFLQVPQVHAAATVSGAADAMLHLVAEDVRDLEQALESIRAGAANVSQTETSIVLSRLVHDRRSVAGQERREGRPSDPARR